MSFNPLGMLFADRFADHSTNVHVHVVVQLIRQLCVSIGDDRMTRIAQSSYTLNSLIFFLKKKKKKKKLFLNFDN